MIASVDPAAPGSAQRIVEIQQAAYAVEAALMSFDGIPPLHETVPQVAALDGLDWHGAFQNGRLVGVIAWSQSGDVLDIDRLAVDPAVARQGYGRRLVLSLPRWPITIVSTGTANKPALSLYTSLGFDEVGQAEVVPSIFTTQLERRG